MILSNESVKRESLVMCLTRAYQRRFDAVGLNRVFRWLCEAGFAICDGDAS